MLRQSNWPHTGEAGQTLDDFFAKDTIEYGRIPIYYRNHLDRQREILVKMEASHKCVICKSIPLRTCSRAATDLDACAVF